METMRGIIKKCSSQAGCVLLLFALLLCLVSSAEASIQAGGSGLAAFFSAREGSIASTQFSLPGNASGITVSYWVKLPPVTGGTLNMKSLSFSAMRARSNLLSYLGFSHDQSSGTTEVSFESYRISAAAVPQNDWSHYVFTWSAETGMTSLYVNGQQKVLDFGGRNVGVLLRFFSLQQEPLNPDCTRTTGGYVLEDSPCEFPFTFGGTKYTSCAPWSAEPFVGGVGPRKTRNLGFDRGLRWCATVPNYAKGSNSNTQRRWGFCSCEDPELTTVDKDMYLYMGAKRASFSGDFPVTSLDRRKFLFMDDCNDSIPPQVSGQSIVVTIPKQSATCSVYTIAQKLDQAGAVMILFAYEGGLPASASSSFTSPQSTGSVQITGDDAFSSAVEIPLRPGKGESLVCSATHALVDKNPNSSTKFCTAEFAETRIPPTATHYGFLVPAGASIAGIQWNLLGKARYDASWVLIDRISPGTSASLRGAANMNVPRQYFFPIAAPFNVSSELQVAYRLEILQCDQPSLGLTLSEFVLLNGVNSTSKVFENGPVTPQSSYFSSYFLPRSSGSTRLNAFVAAVNASEQDFFTKLGKLDVDVYPSIFPVDSMRFPFREQSTLVLGQRLAGSEGRFESADSFTGLLDDVRIYPYSVSRLQAAILHQGGGAYTSNSTAAPSSSSSLFVNDLPYTLFTFDASNGADNGRSKQELKIGVNPNAIDEQQLRFGDRGPIAPRQQLTYHPSRMGQVLGGEVVQPMMTNRQVVLLYVKSARFANVPLNVTIVSNPSFGTLSQLTTLDESLPVVGSVVYTMNNLANWKGDSFVYMVSTDTSALTAQGVVRLVESKIPGPSTPVVQKIFVDPYRDHFFSVGGDFSSMNEPLKLILDGTGVTKGRLFVKNNCSASASLGGAIVSSYFGLVQLSYSPPPFSMTNGDVLDRFTWRYDGAQSRVEMQFVVRHARTILNSFVLSSTASMNSRLLQTTPTGTESPLVSDDRAVIIRFSSSHTGNGYSARGFQLTSQPLMGRLYRYLGPLPSNSVSRIDSIPASHFGKELVLPSGLVTTQKLFVSQVLRTSSRSYDSDVASSGTCSSSRTTSVGPCDRFSDVSNPCCATAGMNNQLESSYDVHELVGSSDSKEFRFSTRNSGHEFVELRFPFKLIAQSVVIRQRRVGQNALFRVSFPRGGTYKRNVTACGGSEHPIQANYSVDLDVEAERSKCDLGSELEAPIPSTDCVTNWESDWIVAWQGSCPLSRSEGSFVADVSWVETTIPVCSLGIAVDVIRLDFDTRTAFDWTGIDSVALVGSVPSSTSESTILVPSSDVVSLIYVPASGVSGTDRFSFTATSPDCRASVPFTHFIPVESISKLFTEKVTIAVSQEDGVFDFDYAFDVTVALDFLSRRLFRNAESFLMAKTLFPPQATMDASIAFPVQANQFGRLDRNAVAYQESKLNLPMNASVLRFSTFGLDATVLVGGDVPVGAQLVVKRFSDSIAGYNASITFNYGFTLSGACGQASPELGACSSKGRPYLNGECANVDGRYQCQCRRSADNEIDIVVTGDFCQYDSLSTCHGRGYPDRKGVCTCFEPELFGADRCNKRKFNTTVEELEQELATTVQRFDLALTSIMEITSTEIVTTQDAVILMGTFGSTAYPLITLNLTDELNPDNNCHGNGVPLNGPLKDADCNCDDGFYPRRTCKSKLICNVGEYKAGTNEDAVCRPCPVGYACDGVDRRLCVDGTFTLEERSTRCYADCTEAGQFNSYLVRLTNTTVQCLPCQTGSYCDGLVSRLCPVGTFWTVQKICIPCNELGLLHYNSVPGSTSCQVCPSGTMRVRGAPGVSVMECVCVPGKWNNFPHNLSLTGVPCVDCPENALCPGFEEDPEATAKLFPPATLRTLQETEDEDKSLNGSAKAYKNSSPFPEEGFWGDPAYPSEFFPCPDECVGGQNFSCKTGFRGRMCSTCEPGFHNINGFCYQCPGGTQDSAAVFFGITGMVLAFVILNRASTEVQALDIALLYAQVANLVQQFSFFFPEPVSSLENYYAVTDFNIDFITTDCVSPNNMWTFTDSFFTQWFLVWYIGALMLLVNGVALTYAEFRVRRQKQVEDLEKEVDLHAQRMRAVKAAARQAVIRAEIRRKQTGEIIEEQEGMAEGPIVDPMAFSSSPPVSNNEPPITANMNGGGGDDPVRRIPRLADIGVLSRATAANFSRSFRSDESRAGKKPRSFIGKMCLFIQRIICCDCCRRNGGSSSKLFSQQSQMFSYGEGSESAVGNGEDKGDPRFKAIARWARRTLGLPKDREEYKTYTNGQLAGWYNLVRVVYNSVIVICLQSFFCVSLADGTSVLRVYPELECGTSEHVTLVAFGVIGVIIYGLGLPVFVYLILTWGAQKNKKADRWFYERFGFMYTGYRQKLYRWELVVLFRRFSMCLILVCADGQPYIQAIFGGTVIVGCLAAQLYHRPYLSDRINVLESIALASIFFYLLCGLVFTGLNDLYYSRQTSSTTQTFISGFSATLSYILLVVSVLTILVCILVFFQDLKDYFNVLVTERSLFRKAKSEDVALIRVIRADDLKVPKADREVGKHLLEMSQGKKRPVATTTTAAGATTGPSSTQLQSQSSRAGDLSMSPASTSTRRNVSQRRRRSSMALLLGGGREKPPHSLFSVIDKDGNTSLSREELYSYVSESLGLEGSEEETRLRIDRIFRMYDIDESGAVDVKEFLDMVRSQMPTTDECELKNTFKPKYLIRWAASKQVTPRSVAMFFELDKSMRQAVADDSIVSAYRDNSKAKFFRAIADAFPFLTDWLAGAKQEDVRVFGKILEELNECRDMVGARGTFSRITVEIDRAPVIWWLVNATEKERDTFRTVFGSICEASSTPRFGFPIWKRIKSGSSAKEAHAEQEAEAALNVPGTAMAKFRTRRTSSVSGPGLLHSPGTNNRSLPIPSPVPMSTRLTKRTGAAGTPRGAFIGGSGGDDDGQSEPEFQTITPLGTPSPPLEVLLPNNGENDNDDGDNHTNDGGDDDIVSVGVDEGGKAETRPQPLARRRSSASSKVDDDKGSDEEEQEQEKKRKMDELLGNVTSAGLMADPQRKKKPKDDDEDKVLNLV